jgi:hypothetical protein
LTVGGPGSNLNVALNVGGGNSVINAGGPGNLTSGSNFFGFNNNVSAGPGPLALAATAFQDNLTVTKTTPGIAINDFRIGGTGATSAGTSFASPAGQTSATSSEQAGRPSSSTGGAGSRGAAASGK